MDRINLLASLCKDSNTICDVGCDHAYVLVKALLEYNCNRGIASDINVGPLSAAKENIKAKGLQDRVDIILSDGFKAIDKPFDVAVVAGMGGNLIKDILSESISKIKDKKLILEPQNDQMLVREFLMKNNFTIVDEYAISENGKYYEIMVAKPGAISYTETELRFGPILLKKKPEAFISYYNRKIGLLMTVINSTADQFKKMQKQKEKMNF